MYTIMETILQLLAGLEGVVGFGIIVIIAIGSVFITRKDIRELNKTTTKA